MKYRIIGADGKTYGPVGLEQIRQWLAEGRVDSRTPVYLKARRVGLTSVQHTGTGRRFRTHAAGHRRAQSGAARARTNGFATAGLICSLLSWLGCCCCCCLPFNLLGILFCIIALVQISSQAEPQEGRAFAIVGLVLSGLSLLISLAGGLVQLALNPSLNWPAQFK